MPLVLTLLICVCLIILAAAKEKPANWVVVVLSVLAMLLAAGVHFHVGR